MRMSSVIGLGFVLVLSACASALQQITLSSPAGSSVSVAVEIARTQAEQERGLMGRTHLGEKEGMLFVFPEEAMRAFWMKNTLIPLDILYFDASGTLVSTVSMTPCTADPCPSYPSAAPAKYALEVAQGFTAEHHIDSTWRLSELPAY